MINEEFATVEQPKASELILEKISLVFFLGTVFFLPIFFIPGMSLVYGKSVILTALVLLGFIFLILAILKSGTISYPKHLISLSVVILPLVFIVSSLFSGSVTNSIIGRGAEIGTFTSILIMTIVLVIASYLLKGKKRLFWFYLSLFASFFVLALFHILRLIIGPEFLSFGIFNSATANLVGKWNELGIFFGLIAIVSLLTIEAFKQNRIFKWLGIVMLAVSLMFLTVVNFYSVWIIVGLFSLLLSIYIFAFRKSPFGDPVTEVNTTGEPALPARIIPVFSIAVLIISLIFIFAGAKINDSIARKFNISQIEVRPSWTSTFEIANHTVKSDPVFGVGPNGYVKQWLAHKPEGVNNTIFWNTDFNFGYGLIPTFIINTGLVGAIAWIFFIATFLWLGFKSIFNLSSKDKLLRYMILTSFFSALYLWVYFVIYVPSTVLYSLAFIFTGVFIASLLEAGLIERKNIVYSADPKRSFVTVLLLVVLITGCVTLGYISGKRIISAYYVEKGIRSVTDNNDAVVALSYILRALKIHESDEYYRVLTQLYIYNMNAAINNPESTPEASRARFEALLPNTIESAKMAVSMGKKNYQNHLALGSIYGSILSLGYKDAYPHAQSAYFEAQKLNPHSPAIVLQLARLEAANENIPKAREYINQSLALKNNYTEAIYLLSQIEISQENIKGAIQAVEAVAFYNPTDPVVYFQIGFLKYADKDYEGSKEAMQRAVAINEQYSNARYFLGLSYYNLGDNAAAINEFEEIEKYNQDNEEVALILSNLRSGNPPFENAKPPVDDKPEERDELPVKDN